MESFTAIGGLLHTLLYPYGVPSQWSLDTQIQTLSTGLAWLMLVSPLDLSQMGISQAKMGCPPPPRKVLGSGNAAS